MILDIRRDRSIVFVRKDSWIFVGTLIFLLRWAFAEIMSRVMSIFVRRDKRIFDPFFPGRARIGGDEAYPALYLADGLR